MHLNMGQWQRNVGFVGKTFGFVFEIRSLVAEIDLGLWPPPPDAEHMACSATPSLFFFLANNL